MFHFMNFLIEIHENILVEKVKKIMHLLLISFPLANGNILLSGRSKHGCSLKTGSGMDNSDPQLPNLNKSRQSVVSFGPFFSQQEGTLCILLLE